jgi:hypothetical protein
MAIIAQKTREVREDGTLYEKVTRWFGYKLHLVVDAEYELPVAYEVRKASESEFPVVPQQIEKLAERHPEMLGECECAAKTGVRIKMALDRRVFTPLSRSSYAWERTYRKRTAVERVNYGRRVLSRLDVSFGFERHFIRGMAKMKFRCGLALVVMLAMALGRVKEKQRDKMRSLVRAA